MIDVLGCWEFVGLFEMFVVKWKFSMYCDIFVDVLLIYYVWVDVLLFFVLYGCYDFLIFVVEVYVFVEELWVVLKLFVVYVDLFYV